MTEVYAEILNEHMQRVVRAINTCSPEFLMFVRSAARLWPDEADEIRGLAKAMLLESIERLFTADGQ
jgi:hypothetical protein